MVLTRDTSSPANSMLAGMRSTPSAWCRMPSPGWIGWSFIAFCIRVDSVVGSSSGCCQPMLMAMSAWRANINLHAVHTTSHRSKATMVRLPCGSASTSRTFLPSIASPIPRFSQVVLFPTPPFWFVTARIVAFFAITSPRFSGTVRKVAVRLVLIVEVHGGGRIVEHCQQILLHVPHGGSIFCQRIQHETDVVGVQLFQPTAYHLGGLVISGNPQYLAFGGTGIHKQVYDLIDGVLIVRAEPEQKVYLQRLRKNSSS